MSNTKNAQLEANIEHLTAEQAAFYNSLPNTQKAAYLATLPAPVIAEGNMHILVKRGGKTIGALTVGRSLAYACDNLEGLLQRDSDRMYAGEVTEAQLKAAYSDPNSEDYLEFIPTRSIDPPENRLATYSKQTKGRAAANGNAQVNPATQPTVNLGA